MPEAPCSIVHVLNEVISTYVLTQLTVQYSELSPGNNCYIASLLHRKPLCVHRCFSNTTRLLASVLFFFNMS